MERTNRCKQWMEDVIAFYIDKNYNVRPADGEELEVIEDAEYILDAIEKQIPKKAYKHKEDYYVCPNCDCQITWQWFESYCEHCGQAIDWSDEE